jgi:mono/diheme cytochrome c family protein
MWKKIAKGAGLLMLLLLVVGCLALAFVYRSTEGRLAQRWDVNPSPITIPTDAASVERGKYLSDTMLGCATCHGEDLGGKDPYQDVPNLLRISTPNITRGGITVGYQTQDWVRTIRHCVKPGGAPLFVMPCSNFAEVTDADLAAVIAYVKSVPAVSRANPPSEMYLLGRTLWGAGMFELMAAEVIEHETLAPMDYNATDLVEHGGYVAQMAGCKDCHRVNLVGGPITGAPPDFAVPANLTPAPDGLGPWTQADFVTAMRTGVRPDGRVLDDGMPWKSYSTMTERDLEALWKYLRSVPAAPLGAEPAS